MLDQVLAGEGIDEVVLPSEMGRGDRHQLAVASRAGDAARLRDELLPVTQHECRGDELLDEPVRLGWKHARIVERRADTALTRPILVVRPVT